MDISAILAGLATGTVLVLFGSGGSIIALPALLHQPHVEPKSAIAIRLGVVAVTAAVTALHNWRKGLIDVRAARVFALIGIAGTIAGRLSPEALEQAFAWFLVAAATHILFNTVIGVQA